MQPDRYPCVVGVDVEVRENTMGSGLYAMRDVEAGEIIGRYTGPHLSADVYKECLASGATSGDYAMVMSSGDVIDGEDAKISGHVRYINHSLRKKNCRAAELNQGPLCIILVEATRAVAAGSEFFLDYGAVYWDNQGFTRFTPQRFVIDYL